MGIRHRVLAVIAIFLAFVQTGATARPIEGSASTPQFGQPSKETVARVRAEAEAAFRDGLTIWLREEMRIDVDTANSVKKFALGKLAGRALEAAEEKGVARGRVWTLTLSVSESAARDALREHNGYFESQAVSHFQTARGNDLNAALPGAISALCAAVAKLEPPGASGGVNTADIRANVQIMFDKMEAKASGTVIEGRPGSAPSKVPSAAISIDGQPLTGFHYTAFAQNGRQLARLTTSGGGEIALSNKNVPFVHNGSMLTISPDARAYLQGADRFIRYRDLGIRFNKGQELTFIYKLPILTYTLEYKAATLDNAIKIPPDFSADAHVRKYLKEFCGLVPAQSASAADLRIRIMVEFSTASFADTEEDAVLMKAGAEFRGSGIERMHKTVFEKRRPFGISLQVGNYFWEASGAVRDLIASTLSND